MTKKESLFDAEPAEIRTSLSSVRNLPVTSSTRLKPDQMISGTFVGNCKNITTMRGQGGTYIGTYLIEVVEVTLGT